jgi:glycosyltransferase involved in cell wall biosynthesis
MTEQKKFKILRLAPTLRATSSSYNQFALGFKDSIDQTLVSLQKMEVDLADNIEAVDGDSSVINMIGLLRQKLRQEDFDIIHIHNSITGVIFLLSIFPFKLGLLKRTVFTLHNCWNVFKKRNQLLNLLVMIFVKRVVTCGRASQGSLPPIVQYLFGHKTRAVINGFDNKRIDRVAGEGVSERFFNTESRLRVIYVGALTDTKNQIALLEALKSTTLRAEVIFLGDGVNRKFLQNFSKSISGTVETTFKGCVSRDSAIQHMQQADVFISLSKGEGLPIAVLEGMYCGCFLILSKIAPHLEVAPPRDRCLYVDLVNDDEIISSLEYAEANLTQIRLGRNLSKKHSVDNFALTKMLDGYMEIYREIYRSSSRCK